MLFLRKILMVSVLALVATGCAKNPVTGKNELLLVGEKWELQTGRENYAPLRQSQGGDYVVDPGVEAYVRKVGQRLAAVSDRKLPYEFNVINDSVPNAWALPGGKISINRGLLTELRSEAELAAVLGHEIVHAAAKHGAKSQTRGVGLQLFSVGAAIGLQEKLGGQVAQAVAGIGAQLINQKYGRGAELESDLYGMEYMARAGYNPQGAVDLQQTFVNLSGSRKSNTFERLFASHPPSQLRVETNKKTAARLASGLPNGGDMGKERYQKAMARLIKSKPAYIEFDKARAAYKKGNKKSAVALANKAIRLEPKEALFYSALGDAANADKKYRSAKSYYNKAINLNSDYFYYYLRRGEVNQLTRNYAAAKKDLQRSIELLPTADAQEMLGDVASVTNDPVGATNAYRLAARAGGTSAYSKLLKLDLGKNPNSYLQSKAGISQKGTLAVQVKNSTPNTITGIEVQVVSGTSRKTLSKRAQRALPAGKAIIIDFGIRITKEQVADLNARVTSAQLAR